METKLCLCSPEIVNVVIMGEICTSVEGPLNAPPPHLSATYLLIFHGAIKVLSKRWFSSMQQPGSCTAWQGPTKGGPTQHTWMSVTGPSLRHKRSQHLGLFCF